MFWFEGMVVIMKCRFYGSGVKSGVVGNRKAHNHLLNKGLNFNTNKPLSFPCICDIRNLVNVQRYYCTFTTGQ